MPELQGTSAHDAPRRPYAVPSLTVYGTLADLTQAVANMSKADGGSVNGMKKSQP